MYTFQHLLLDHITAHSRVIVTNSYILHDADTVNLSSLDEQLSQTYSSLIILISPTTLDVDRENGEFVSQSGRHANRGHTERIQRKFIVRKSRTNGVSATCALNSLR